MIELLGMGTESDDQGSAETCQVFCRNAEDGGGFECPCGGVRVGQGLVKDYGWGCEGGFVGVA